MNIKTKNILGFLEKIRKGFSVVLLVGFVSVHAEEVVVPQRAERGSTLEDRVFRLDKHDVFSFHKLNYVVLGGQDLKLQYSFKYRPVDDLNFFLAFTNYILWDVYEESIPVEDNNFNPEAFYRVIESQRHLVAADAGYVHVSNGRAGTDSRAIDRLFVRGHKMGRVAGFNYYVLANAYLTLAKGDYNQNYGDYLGVWDTTLWIRNVFKQKAKTGFDIEYQRTSGPHGNPFQRGNNLIGLQYSPPGLPRFNPTFYVQWFNGYGEVILDYNKSHEELRGGVSWYY